jgi:hypothetical protein
MVNLALQIHTLLVNPDLVDLECLGNFCGVELFLVNLELMNLYQTCP